MNLEHTFTVPVAPDSAYDVLLDIDRVVGCMPGAALLSRDGDDFTGTVKVKLGPIGLTYKGSASLIEKDALERRLVLKAQGRDARGNGTAAALVSAVLSDAGSAGTRVEVCTELDITGKPAQFGRGLMVDVGTKLLGQFADALAATLQDRGRAVTDEADAVSVARSTAPAPAATTPTPPSDDAISLLDAAGPAVLKRLAPVVIPVVLALVIARRRRR